MPNARKQKINKNNELFVNIYNKDKSITMTTKNSSLDKWIQRLLEKQRLGAKSLTVTVFGDSILPHGGAVLLGGLIDLLAPFGINDRSVRTSVFRLTMDDWLVAHREGRRSHYSLTASGWRRFEHASRRIYSLPSEKWDGTWTLVLLPRAADYASDRAKLRRELELEGFGLIAPGVFGHLAADIAVLGEILDGLKQREKVFVVSAKDLEGFSSRPFRELVRQCWNLRSLATGYQTYCERFEPVLMLLRDGNISPEQAFLVRTLMIHTFRRVTLHDPHLPVDALPEHWPGHVAYALSREIYKHLYKKAESHLQQVLEGAGAHLPKAALEFYRRFGGLT